MTPTYGQAYAAPQQQSFTPVQQPIPGAIIGVDGEAAARAYQIRKIEAKGYDFQESERLARSIFAEHEARPQGMSIEERVRQVLTREE